MTTRADLERLGYTVDVAPDGSIAAVRGFGVAVTVHRDDAAALFDSLADSAAHAERVFQHARPEVHAAKSEVEGAGYKVERLDRSGDLFRIAAPKWSSLTPPPPEPVTADELAVIAERLRGAK